MLIFKEKIEFPDKNDKFFIQEGYPEEIAWIHKPYQEFGTYADSYQTGALNLINCALKEKSLRDYNIYPAIFLIRHYLELRLKELIQCLNYLNNDTKDFPAHHKLDNLWGDFKSIYALQRDQVNEVKYFGNIDNLIKEFVSVDPDSMSFRYPIDKQENKSQKLEYVNLRNLKLTFIKVCSVFDIVSNQLNYFMEMKEESISDFYSNNF